MPRYFTVEQANETLDTLRPLMRELQEAKKAADVVRAELARLTPPSGGNGHAPDPQAMRVKSRELARLTQRSERLLRSIHNLDCAVKDVDRGLVDFPALRDGREVCLCWLIGEPAVSWWHDVDAGFQGRRPL